MGQFEDSWGSIRKAAGRALRRAGLATRRDLNEQVAATATLTSRLEWLAQRVDALEERERWRKKDLEVLTDRASVEAVTRWLGQLGPTEHPLISVVMPTKDRPARLERAIRSLLAQRYENWELVIVDDGESHDARQVVEALSDPRISCSRNPGRGSPSARNRALELARGGLIAYLDDDNLMDPGWLHAVAWVFEQRPDIDVVYGAHVLDDYLRFEGESSGGLPWIYFSQWNRELLKEVNLADQSALAHRAGLPGAWYEPTLEAGSDWNLLLRLTADKDPLALPVVACYYTTDAPDRICAEPDFKERRAEAAARALER